MDKVDKLEEAIKSIHKRFGKGSLLAMSDHSAAEPVNVISTGSENVNEITGVGGIARGRISEVFGPEGGGKTTLCLQTVREAQKLGGLVAYIDAENALDINYARALGVNVDALLISQPDAGEDALEIVEALTRSGGVMLIVIDSVAALVPRSVLEGEMGDPPMAVQARLMSQAMMKLVKAAHVSETSLVFVNQIRDKIGVMFGNPETTPGGKALKFYSSLRLDIRRISQIKKSDSVIGQNVKVKCIKNKLAIPYRDAECQLIYGQGFAD